jgi:Predicted metal-binding, possibly nucleic acid-binding protein
VTTSINPYRINVRDLVHRPGELREHDLRITVPDQLGEGLVSVKAGSELGIDVRLESVHEGILVSAEVEADATGVCGRCLTDITLPLQVDFQELFAYPSREAFDTEVDDAEVHDDHVDLEPLVRDAVVLALPFQPVCRPDCPGLDPETGERLAEQPEREPGSGIDPRWAALGRLNATEHEDGDTGRHEQSSRD